MELNPEPIDIENLIKNSLFMIKEKALKHKINIDIKIDKNLAGIKIMADKLKFKQIIFNLLSNAVKFTPDNGAVHISAKKVSILDLQSLSLPKDAISNLCHEDNNFVKIAIKDTGIGIDVEDQKRIFDKFYQVKGGMTDKTPGAGLGLGIVKKIVALHGGKIWLESKGAGKGSNFNFILPFNTNISKNKTSQELT